MRTWIGMACAVAMLTAGCSAHATETGPQLTAKPDGVSMGIPVQVTVEGLPAGDQVRVWARTYDRHGQLWESSGEFVTDGVGQVDLSTAASTGGTYTGVDPHGLFWSMRLPDQKQAPYPLMDADDVVVLLGVDRAGATVARTTLRRVVRESAGRVRPIAEAGLVGDLYLPPGAGVPDLPTTRTAIPYGPETIDAGGDPATTAAAVRSTFSATVDLLRKVMPRGRG
jgi:hypothetical protein